MNVKEAEERAKDWVQHQESGFGMAEQYLALLGLARRLADWTVSCHSGHPNPRSCYGCKLQVEAREAGLLEAPE